MSRYSAIEPLENRIAPAVAVFHPIPDLVAGIGKTGATIDLETVVDPDASFRTLVRFETNFTLPGQNSPAVIELELFDDKAPLTVQNFVSYVNGMDGANYDGTFFHRIFDFGANSEAGTDIIQAGGFDVSKLTTHIPTGPTLHNEYTPDDPELQNTRGTIAMAKTGVSPDTATSEWFINLTNNSSILGETNNGGFTVFGKVTDESLAVIDAIGKATKINGGGALTDLPVQSNYPTGSKKAPKPDQLFQIVDAEIIAPAPTDANGHTFSLVGVNVPGTSTASDLLNASIDASNNLVLTYNGDKTGKAEVTVEISRTENDVTTTHLETFLVTVQPNLIAEVPTHTLGDSFKPGDSGTADVLVTNTAGGLAKGEVKVNLYLSNVVFPPNGGAPDPITFAVDANDYLLSQITVDLDLASGESQTIPIEYTIPWNVGERFLINGKQFVVVAEVDSDIGEAGEEDDEIQELFTDDNDGALQRGHFFDTAFGTIRGQKNVPLTINGTDGVSMTFKFKGPGTGVVTKNVDGTFSLNITESDASSRLSLKTTAVVQEIQDIFIANPIGHLKLPNVHLLGDFSAAGGAKSIVFGDLGVAAGDGVDRVFSVNASSALNQRISLTFGTVNNYSLASEMPIAKMTATEWLNDEEHTGPDEIFAAGLGRLKVGGNLEASLFVAGEAKVRQISVGGEFRDATIKTLGDIGSIKLGGLSGGNIFVGLESKPDALEDFSAAGTIGTFRVDGTMAGSVVAAAKFNSIVVGTVNTAAGFGTGGFYADAIKSYVRKGIDPARFSHLDDTSPDTVAPTTYDASGKYEVAVF